MSIQEAVYQPWVTLKCFKTPDGFMDKWVRTQARRGVRGKILARYISIIILSFLRAE